MDSIGTLFAPNNSIAFPLDFTKIYIVSNNGTTYSDINVDAGIYYVMASAIDINAGGANTYLIIDTKNMDNYIRIGFGANFSISNGPIIRLTSGSYNVSASMSLIKINV